MNTMRKTLAVWMACLLALGAALPWTPALATDNAADKAAREPAEEDDATPEPDSGSEEKASEGALIAGDFAIVEVKSGTVNLRKTATAKGVVLARLPRNTRLEVLEVEGDWAKVAFKAKTGYVKLNYLKKAEDAPVAGDSDDEDADGKGGASAVAGGFAQVKLERGTLNLRRTANDGAKVAAKLPKDSKVWVLEEDGVWAKVNFNGKTGFVKAAYLEPVTDIPFDMIEKGDKGDAVIEVKRKLHKLGYLKSDEINTRFDPALEDALTKLQLINGLPLTPGEAGPELQALLSWGKPVKCKSGYAATATDKDSGLTVSIFCWDAGGRLYEEDQAVKVKVAFAAQGSGGQPPYAVTVAKSLSADGDSSAEEVASPFSYIWKRDTDALYLYATVRDAAGNTATARARFRYALPSRYTIDPDAID